MASQSGVVRELHWNRRVLAVHFAGARSRSVAQPHTHTSLAPHTHTLHMCGAAPHTHFTCFAVRARARALRRRPRIFNGRRVRPNRLLRAHVPRICIGAASRRLLPLLIAQSQIRCERACTQLRRHMSLCARCSWRAGLTKTSASHWGRGLSHHFTCATKAVRRSRLQCCPCCSLNHLPMPDVGVFLNRHVTIAADTAAQMTSCPAPSAFKCIKPGRRRRQQQQQRVLLVTNRIAQLNSRRRMNTVGGTSSQQANR